MSCFWADGPSFLRSVSEGWEIGDFGPTLAAEKLRERHGVDLAVETVRSLMVAGGYGCREDFGRRRFNNREAAGRASAS